MRLHVRRLKRFRRVKTLKTVTNFATDIFAQMGLIEINTFMSSSRLILILSVQEDK